eukprot:5176760-Prymnesium_polylepis.1
MEELQSRDDVKKTSRTLLMDGWDDLALNSLVNFVVATVVGDDYLGDEDVTGQVKDGALFARLAYERTLEVQRRHGSVAE